MIFSYVKDELEVYIICTSGFNSVFHLFHQAVTALVKNFPKPMVSSMQQILPIVWNTLTESAALYPIYNCVLAHFFLG